MSTDTSRGPGRPRANCDSEEPLVGLDVRVSIETGSAIEATGPMVIVMGETLRTIRARIAADERDAAKAEAARRKGSAAGVVREAIEEWISRQTP